MIVVDASVLVAQLDATDAHHDQAGELLLAHAAHPVAASVITVAEVLVGPARSGRLEVAQEAVRGLLDLQVPLDEDASGRLARLRAESGLKLPDCCVLLAARDTAATALLTFDRRLAVAARAAGLKPAGA